MSRLLITFAFIFISACQHSSNDVAASCNKPVSTTDTISTPSLTLQLLVKDKFGQEVESFIAGEDVIIELRLTNNTNSEITYSATGPGYDFLINMGCDTVWSAFYGMTHAMVITDRTIAANETSVFTATWTGLNNDGSPVMQGEYKTISDVAFFFEGKQLTSPESKVISLN